MTNPLQPTDYELLDIIATTGTNTQPALMDDVKAASHHTKEQFDHGIGRLTQHNLIDFNGGTEAFTVKPTIEGIIHWSRWKAARDSQPNGPGE